MPRITRKMILTLLHLLRSPEVDMDMHFEINMRLKRDRPTRPSFFSRLVHIGEEKILDSAERHISPRPPHSRHRRQISSSKPTTRQRTSSSSPTHRRHHSTSPPSSHRRRRSASSPSRHHGRRRERSVETRSTPFTLSTHTSSKSTEQREEFDSCEECRMLSLREKRRLKRKTKPENKGRRS